MDVITGISDSPAQVFNLTPPDGTTVTLTIFYRPQPMGWFYNLSWNGTNPATQINGRRIVNYPNLLRQWKEILTFGICCVTQDGREPLGQKDFVTNYALLLLLSKDDIAAIESVVFPGRSR